MENLELYLDKKSGKVFETNRLVDVNGGMNPVYYMVLNDRIKVSSSAYSLIKSTGCLKRNHDFDPPNWTKQYDTSKINIKKSVLKYLSESISYKKSASPWYACWQTMDERVFKLRPHEVITPNSSNIKFKPKNEIASKKSISKRASSAIKRFIGNIEISYPNAENVVLTGGKDSQLIHAVKKKNPKKWHYLTADPNFSKVKKWISSNKIEVNKSYRVDNINRESMNLLKEKIIASDLYSDISHIRWLKKMKEISERTENKVIYWVGTEGDTFFSFNSDYNSGSRQKFWRMHQTRAPSWQGNFHQVVFNVTGSAILSPYHSKEMWGFLRKYDPKSIEKGDDLRDDICKEMNEEIRLMSHSKSPKPYVYEEGLNTNTLYLDELKIDIQGG